MIECEKQETIPQWAKKIASMRRQLRISQAELARRLECSAMTVSRWERGQLAPSADYYIQLGRLAKKSDRWFFWERAGLQVGDVLSVVPHEPPKGFPKMALPDLEDAAAGTGEQRTTSKNAHVVPIPLLKAVAGTPGCAGDKRLSLHQIPAQEMVGAPYQWCPNPAYTSLVRVRGHSMEPLIRDGDIVAVDSLQTDRSKLDGKILIVSSEEKGLCVTRFRRFPTVDVLEPESREYQAIILGKNSGWRIVARVLWWITSAP
jgi:phage repressor protein C with HTH and peptisase S24 domain